MTLPIYKTAATALDALRKYIAQELSITCIEAMQDDAQAGRPALPDATVLATRSRDLSLMHTRVGDELNTPEGDDDELTHEFEITRMRELVVEVSFYGDTGPANAELLPTTTGRLSGREFLQDNGIQIRALSDVVDTRVLRSTAHEATAMIEIAVLYAIIDQSSVPVIETVTSDVTGTSTDYDVT